VPAKSDVLVGVIDSGLDYAHACIERDRLCRDVFNVDLQDRVWSNPKERYNGVDDDRDGYIDDVHGINARLSGVGPALPAGHPIDDAGHGTEVAGIVAAKTNNDRFAIAGVVGTTTVHVVPCKAMNSAGAVDTCAAIRCLRFFKSLRVRGFNVVATNNSWGERNVEDALLEHEIDENRRAGILFVVSAGRDRVDNDEFPFYPASSGASNVIAVAMTDKAGSLESRSDSGAHSIHVAAPGLMLPVLQCDVCVGLTPGGSDWSDNIRTGTSFAAAHVTGLIA